MQAVVKTPHININIRGEIPKKIISTLKEEYGNKVKFIEDNDDELINVFETDWYKKIKSQTTPGNNLKIYREIHGLKQEELGKMLGGIHRQHISNMEKGIRSISIKTVKMLAEIFKVSPEKFI
jgi:DNA-binding XRE family transcriptional regulator